MDDEFVVWQIVRKIVALDMIEVKLAAHVLGEPSGDLDTTNVFTNGVVCTGFCNEDPVTSRKLIPALFHLYRKQRLPAPINIVGFSRSPLSDDQWRSELAADVAKFSNGRFDESLWREFASVIHYQPGDVTKSEDFESLARRLQQLESNEPTVPSARNGASLRSMLSASSTASCSDGASAMAIM